MPISFSLTGGYLEIVYGFPRIGDSMYVVSDTQQRILQDFAMFHLLTVDHVWQLHFGRGSRSYASTQLQALWQEKSHLKFLERIALPSTIRAGSVPYVYFLSNRGRSYLRRSESDLSQYLFPSRQQIVSASTLHHTLAVTDFLVAGKLLQKYASGITISRLFHDLTIRRMLQRPVVFDGWIDFLINGTYQQCIALEWERNKKDEQAFAKKIVALLQFLSHEPLTKQSRYEAVFGTDVLTLAYATPISATYVLKMLAWTEKVLARLHQERSADVFRFRYLPVGTVDPTTYLMPSWTRPFDTQLLPLLEI